MPKSARLRASNACEYCRQRKTRCDEGKPACSLCSQRGVQCIYKSVSPSKMETTIVDLYKKLERIETKLEEALQTGKTPYDSNYFQEEGKVEENIKTYDEDFLTSLFFDNDIFSKPGNKVPYMIPSFDIDLFAPRDTVFRTITEEDFIFNEDRYSIKGRLEVQNKKSSSLLSAENVERYSESYLVHIYPVYPIACELQIHDLKQNISITGLQANLSSCMMLVLLALGSLTESGEEANIKKSVYWNDKRYHMENSQVKVAPPAGWDYFWLALAMREKIMITEKRPLLFIAIRLLMSVYYLKIGELSAHLDELAQCSKLILKEYLIQDRLGKTDEDSQEPLIRFYWICLHLERQASKLTGSFDSLLYKLQSTIKLPPGCKSHFPRDSNGFYTFCFMANILLSNINDKTFKIIKKLESETFNIEKVCYIVSKFEIELQNWRASLSLELQWDDEIFHQSNEGLELRMLRLQYHLCHASAYYILVNFLGKNPLKLVGRIIEILQKCVGSVLNATHLFAESDVSDLTPIICYEIMAGMKIMAKAQKLLNNEWRPPLEFSFLLKLAISKIEKFSSHSFLISKELDNLKENFYGAIIS